MIDEPKFPPSRFINENCIDFCDNCGSSMKKNGWLGWLGELLCINNECDNSISKKNKLPTYKNPPPPPPEPILTMDEKVFNLNIRKINLEAKLKAVENEIFFIKNRGK